jgi:GNAT superfamily N-acetyltransferase
MTITDATRNDTAVITDLAKRIWPVAFHAILSPAQIAYMLEWMYSPVSLQEQMKKGHHFLLLKEEDDFIGYASWSWEEGAGVARLHKIYVLPEMHGRGGGSLLLKEVTRRARLKGQQGLQLNVNRFNPAVAFYRRKGFRIIREEDNDIGEGYFMNDYVMQLSL